MSALISARRHRRRLVLLLTVVGGALVTLVGLSSTGPAHATSGGDPYSVLSAVDLDPAPGVFETTIVAQEATVDLGGGVTAHAQTFNGSIPGPELRLHVGDTVIVHFENQLDHATGIHWHGIELANASDGTPLTQNQVPPGATFLYRFRVTRPGVYWYHPHHHSSTNQIFRGLYGPIVVADPHEAALRTSGVLPPAAQTLTLALSDTTVCKAVGSNDAVTYDPSLPWAGGGAMPPQPGPAPQDLCETTPIDEHGDPRGPYAAGDIPSIQKSGTAGRVNEGQTVLTNGRNVGGRGGSPSAPGALAAGAATFPVQAGQGLRLQIGNAATIRFFRLRLTDAAGAQIPLVRVGGQGGLLDHAVLDGGTPGGFDFKYDAGEILLDPGDRADVVAAIPATASGVLTLWTQDFKRTGTAGGGGFANVPTVPVMHLAVTGTAATPYAITAGTALLAAVGAAVETLPAPSGTLLDPGTFSPAKPGLASPAINLTATGTSLGIDGVIGAHDFPGDYTTIPHFGSARYAKPGDVLELTVVNTTGAHHPFHLHGFSIQPLDLTKAGAPTYTFPPDFRDNVDVPAGYTLRYRVRLDARPLVDGATAGGELGRWVFHCHIFHHASFGMISEFVVAAADGNERPYVDASGASVTVDEGQTAALTGTFSDPDGDAVTLTASVGTVTPGAGGTWSWSYPTTDGPDQSQAVYVTATDEGGRKAQAAFELEVNNLPPSVVITAPPAGALYAVPAAVTVTASITDPGSADALTCTFAWDDGGPVSTVAPSGGTCSATRTFAQAGVYTVTVTGDDGDGGTDADSVVVVVYDPSAGFVTGGGTIDSPPGAYVAAPLLAGEATFGFVARYQKGATVPTGQTQFTFDAAGFEFHSTSYHWLVVAGAKAQYKGTGTVNGGGTYGFLLTLTDGQLTGGGGTDRFRLKVWDTSTEAVVYDNRLGSPEDVDVADPQALASGSIVVHKGR